MATRHERFALREVTFDGVAMSGATIDRWQRDGGGARWSARFATRRAPVVDEGELIGRMADGRLVAGHAIVTDRDPGPNREVLVVLRGVGDLRDQGDAPR